MGGWVVMTRSGWVGGDDRGGWVVVTRSGWVGGDDKG